jgi:hypothetical protein
VEDRKFAIIEVAESEIDNPIFRELAKTKTIGSETRTDCVERLDGTYRCTDRDSVT